MVDRYIAWLLIILPFALITGPFLPDTLISILAIYFLLRSFKPDMLFYYRHPLVKLIFIFWAYCIIRSLLSSNPIMSLEASLFYGRFIFFSLAVAFLLNQNRKTFVFFGWSLISCITIVMIDAYWEFITGENILGWKPVDSVRISSFFGDELVLGGFLARLIPFGFFFLASIPRLKSWMMILGLTFLIAADILIYLAGERVAFFYLTLGTLLIIILIQRFRWIRLLSFLLSAFIIIMITALLPPVKSRMIDNTIKQLGIGDANISLNFFSPEHEQHYISAIKMFYDNPLFGQGPKLFRNLCTKTEFNPLGCSTHPHNTYFQLLAELGVLGFLPVIGLFIYIIFLFIKQFYYIYINKKGPLIDDSQICLLITMVIILWPLAPTGNFFGNWNNIFYYLPIGFYIFKTYHRTPQK